MMVAGDMPPSAEEQVLRERLVGCGLKAAGISMVYDEDTQGYIITIGDAAGVTNAHFECIEKVTLGNWPVFEDKQLDRTFKEASYARATNLWLAEARKILRERGLLESLPRRSHYASVDEFVAALERHCGFEVGSILKEREGKIEISPENISEGHGDYSRLSALIAAVSLASVEIGDVKIGFIGNERLAD
ncbi:hypothetical protein C7W88_07260 [Novosphingobium sp. THN1]|nr:hypothetical protein C7W88_07260 [Novosphingobium sp. THN1]